MQNTGSKILHKFDLDPRPFNAIRNGTKKVEVRTNTPFFQN